MVTFKTGGIPELVTHKEDGYIATYGELDDLISGLELFLRDSTDCDIRKRSFEKVNLKFSLNRMLKEYLDLYDSLLQ